MERRHTGETLKLHIFLLMCLGEREPNKVLCETLDLLEVVVLSPVSDGAFLKVEGNKSWSTNIVL